MNCSNQVRGRPGRRPPASPARPGRSALQDLSYAYDPVGNVLRIEDQSQSTRYFSNQRVEPANTYRYDSDYGFRYYAPWLQCWINPDPAGDADGLNRYRMVGNGPVNRRDVQGLEGVDATIYMIVAAIVVIGAIAAIAAFRGQQPVSVEQSLSEKKLKPPSATNKNNQLPIVKENDESRQLAPHIRDSQPSGQPSSSHTTTPQIQPEESKPSFQAIEKTSTATSTFPPALAGPSHAWEHAGTGETKSEKHHVRKPAEEKIKKIPRGQQKKERPALQESTSKTEKTTFTFASNETFKKSAHHIKNKNNIDKKISTFLSDQTVGTAHSSFGKYSSLDITGVIGSGRGDLRALYFRYDNEWVFVNVDTHDNLRQWVTIKTNALMVVKSAYKNSRVSSR
ncbi:hypothetical protein D3C84_47760 [compost metagenome]